MMIVLVMVAFIAVLALAAAAYFTMNSPSSTHRRTAVVEGAPSSSTSGSNSNPNPVAWLPGDPRLQAKGEIPPVEVKNGIKAYKVTYKAGMIHGEGSDVNMRMSPTNVFPSEEVRLSFKWYVDDNWPWEQTDSQRVSGKIIGFFGGDGDASGGKYSTTAFSARMTFDERGTVYAYLYPQLRTAHRGNPSWELLDQPPQVQKIGRITTGMRLFAYPDDANKSDFLIQKGRWNSMEIYVKLNTPGQKNGVLELSVNGVRRRVEGVRYRNTDIKLGEVRLHTFFGGGTKEYAPRTTTHSWYGDIVLSK